MRTLSIFVLALCLAACYAEPKYSNRIVGGTLTTINQHPFTAAMLYSPNLITYSQACGGTILTPSAVVSAAHCYVGDAANRWRIRVGSSFANSGGVVHVVGTIRIHPSYTDRTIDPDLAILRTTTNFVYNANVGPARIAAASYNMADNTPVVALGWGRTSEGGPQSEQLRQVTIWTVNHAVCTTRYAQLAASSWWHVPSITNGMLCAGWLDVGGRDACQGDSGGPLVHVNDVLVGVTSWGEGCARAQYPGVNSRVSFYTTWIQTNAVN